MHRAALSAAGINADYVKLEVAPGELPGRLQELRDGRWAGFNVTIPHKLAALQLADDPDPQALRLGAANTLWTERGRIRAANTDFQAINEILAANQIDRSAAVAIVGAGGAARAALLAVVEFGSICLLNRTPARALTLADELCPKAVALDLASPAAWAAAANADLIINASSVGMTGGPAPDRSPLPDSCFHAGQVVMDMVYRPLQTRLLADAGNCNAQVIDGLSMLVAQGAASFFIWTGQQPDVAAMRAAVTLGGRPAKRIWLVGLSGAGKSTIARRLAEMLGWHAIDSDQLIRQRLGMDIPEIMGKFGEPYFRHLEREQASRASNADRAVIATGGGQMQIDGMRDLMLESGLVVYLRASPETCARRLAPVLASEHRPMLAGPEPLTEQIAGLLAARRKIYESAHRWLDVDDVGPDQAALALREMLLAHSS